MLMTKEALRQHCGRKQAAAIKRWLDRERIPYRLDADLFPIVDDQDLRATPLPGAQKPARKKGPNLEWLKNGQTPN